MHSKWDPFLVNQKRYIRIIISHELVNIYEKYD